MKDFLKWLLDEHWLFTMILVFVILPSFGTWCLKVIQALRGHRLLEEEDDDEEEEEEDVPARVHIKASGGSTVTNIRVGGKKVKPKKPRAPRKPRIRVKEGQVFHVTDAKHGKDVIVHATNEEEACRVAAAELRVEEDDLEAVEVYDRVIRK